MFEVCHRNDQKIFLLLDDFLNYCYIKDVYVIGFLPPYAQEIYDKIKEDGGYEYIFKLRDELNSIFNKYDYQVFDFTDMSSFGAEKCEVIDGIHASEKAYLRLFIKMAESDKKLAKYVDIIYLKDKLESENSCYDVFRFEF